MAPAVKVALFMRQARPNGSGDGTPPGPLESGAGAMSDVFTADDIERAEHYQTLGPAYFAARRIAEGLMQNADADPFKAVAKKCIDDISTAVYEYVEDHLRNDMEMNLQHHMSSMAERSVLALLTGEPWALQQYALVQNHDGEAVRAAVAKHGGDAVLMARIADLEKRNTELSEALKREREWNRR